MTTLADATLKVSALVLAALAATSLLRSRSAALRHSILAAAIVGAALTPLLTPLVPSWHVNLSVLSPVSDATSADQRAAQSGRTFSLSTAGADSRADLARSETLGRLLGLAWLAGVACSLFALAAGLGRLAWLAARSDRVLDAKWTVPAHEIAQAYGVFRPVVLLQSQHPTLLVTWGARWPKVILPRGAQEWTDDRIRVVLCHELAHIGRRDWLVQMTAELLRSAYWFNPLVWIACRRLRQESEHACDDAVLNAGIRGTDYATHLLDLARAAIASRPDRHSPALAIARPSSLERRIRVMLKSGRNRVPLSRAAAFAVAFVWLGAASAVAGFGMPERTPVLSFAVAPAKVVPLSILNRSNGPIPAQNDPAVGVVAGASLEQVVSFATLTGTISDQTGGLLPGVTVTLTNPARQSKYEVRTDRNGQFEFTGVQAGDYVIEVSLLGFATLRGPLNVGPGGDMRTDLRLAIGSIIETITVTGNRNSPTVTASDTGPRAGGGSGRGTAPTCNPPVAGGIGGNIRQPIKLRDVRPIYPVSAQANGIQGVVILKAVIGVDGFVRDVEILRTPDPDLASAAVTAVQGWEFRATQLNCVPVNTDMTVTMNFSLQ